MNQPPSDQNPQQPSDQPPQYAAPPAPGQTPPPQYSAPPAPPQYQGPQYQGPSAPQYQAPQAPQYQPPQYAYDRYAPPASAPQYQAPPAQQYQVPPQFPQPLPHQPLPTPGAGGIFDGALHPDELQRPLYGANPVQAIARFFKNYANFKGRASRSEFWWTVLAFWGAVLVFSGIAAGVDEARYSMPYEVYSAMQGLSTVFGLLILALMLGTLVPWLAITWRRLHDADMPGPLYFLNFIPYLGGIVLIVLTALPPKPSGRRFDPPTS